MDAGVAKLLESLVYVVGVLVGVWWFKDNIRGLLDRTKSVKGPGGVSADFGQQERNVEEKKPIPATPSTTNPSAPRVIEQSNTAPLSEDDQKRLIDENKSHRELMYYWEYMYLNHFLARGTQELLDWLIASGTRYTIQIIDRALAGVYPQEERSAMFSALQTHHLIQKVGELVEVTPKGKEYALTFRGPLPALVPRPPVPPTPMN